MHALGRHPSPDDAGEALASATARTRANASARQKSAVGMPVVVITPFLRSPLDGGMMRWSAGTYRKQSESAGCRIYVRGGRYAVGVREQESRTPVRKSVLGGGEVPGSLPREGRSHLEEVAFVLFRLVRPTRIAIAG